MTISKTATSLSALLIFAGAAVAQSNNSGPVSNQMVLPPQMPMGSGGSNLGSAQLFAVINSNGTVARGKGEAAAVRLGVGYYRVAFSRDITNCGYVASVGGVGTELATGIANPTRLGSGFVLVRTFALNGVQADRPFHLYIDC